MRTLYELCTVRTVHRASRRDLRESHAENDARCDFGKRHDNVLQDIQRLEVPEDFTHLNFQASEYTDPTGRKLPFVRVTRDGFVVLVMAART